MNALTVFVFLTLAIVLQATTPRRQTGKTHPTNNPDENGVPQDVSDSHIQDLARAAVANYTLSGTTVCLKHSYTFKSVDNALLLNRPGKCYRLHITMVYNSNCPFSEAKVCKHEPSKNDREAKLEAGIDDDSPNPKFQFLSHPEEISDC